MRYNVRNCSQAYTEQQEALNSIAAALGVVAYRPNYHAKANDKNTVLLYTKEDAAHNKEVDAELISYTRSQAADLSKAWKQDIQDKFVYRDCFWCFENSDINGGFSLQSANHGKLNLGLSTWRQVLEGDIRIALARKMQHLHIAKTGGLLALREADEVYNNLNREIIKAMKLRDGHTYMGSINIYQDRERVISGEEDVYKEYLSGPIYNFACDFCVPVKDEELRQRIIRWNREETLPKSGREVDEMTKRIEKLGGINFIWF